LYAHIFNGVNPPNKESAAVLRGVRCKKVQRFEFRDFFDI
jgi:hypothetical protein